MVMKVREKVEKNNDANKKIYIMKKCRKMAKNETNQVKIYEKVGISKS